MGTGERIRAFIAVHPSVEVIDRIRSLQQALRRDLGSEGFKWAKTEQLHLTLQFLGYIPAESVSQFESAISSVAVRHQPFTLRANALGCFPSPKRPRVLWVGLTGAVERIIGIKEQLDTVLQPLGYKPETRPFHPHITLARIAEPTGAQRKRLQEIVEEQAGYIAGEFNVATIDLMQSVLSREGATYRLLSSAHLQPT